MKRNKAIVRGKTHHLVLTVIKKKIIGIALWTFEFKVLRLISGEKHRVITYHGLNCRRGIGMQVKKTVTSRKDLRPQTSERAPISGAHRKDNIPWKEIEIPHYFVSEFIDYKQSLFYCKICHRSQRNSVKKASLNFFKLIFSFQLMKHIPPIRREYLLSSFYIYWNPGSIEMSTRVLTDLHWALNIYMRKP